MALQVYTAPSSSVEINPRVTEPLVEYLRDTRVLSLYHSILVGTKSLEQLYVIELPTVPMTALEVIIMPALNNVEEKFMQQNIVDHGQALVTPEGNVAACTLSKGAPHNHSVGANDIVWIICDGECAGEI